MSNPRRTAGAWLKYDAMADASKGCLRLYEVVWNASPELAHDERVALARRAVRELISDDLPTSRVSASAPSTRKSLMSACGRRCWTPTRRRRAGGGGESPSGPWLTSGNRGATKCTVPVSHLETR